MRVRSKFWLEDDSGEAVFGEGRRKILEHIQELGSMQATAKALNMSYRGVWARIKATEERLGVKLVETSVGRGKNRGSRLTPEAQKLLKDFKILNRKGTVHTDKLFASIVEGVDDETPPLVWTFAVVGPKGCGKTRFIARLAAEWSKRGRRIGLLTPSETLPERTPENEDLFKSGISISASEGSGRMVLELPQDLNLTPESLGANYFPGCDLVLYKSDQRVQLPTIELYNKKIGEKPLTRKSRNLLAVVGDQPEGKSDWPHFQADQITELIEFIEKKHFAKDPAADVAVLTVDGRRVPMLPFVQNMIENAVIGMVSSLKSCDNPKEIELRIKK